jgi:hypothetical protein
MYTHQSISLIESDTQACTYPLLAVNGVTSAKTSGKRRLQALSSAYVLSAPRLVVLQLSTCNQRDADNSVVL